MKKTKLNAGKLNPAPLKFQISTLFKFTGGETNASRTDPTTFTITTNGTTATRTHTRIESAEMMPLIVQNTTLSF